MREPDPSTLPPNEIATLLAIMRALRQPDTGCPWDIEQTFESIAPYTIEEAYEVADAIDRGNMEDLREELGDLLLQVVYHSQIASERGDFNFEDTVTAITTKMIRRHPHVFGEGQERGVPLKPGFWERMKDRERKYIEQGVLSEVPVALPALTRSVKLQDKAARANFDWPDTTGVLNKIAEEVKEFADAETDSNPDAMEEEFGDLLFVLANLARHKGIDPERALKSACTKFIKRFNYIEQVIVRNNEKMTNKTLEELDALWEEAKLRQQD